MLNHEVYALFTLSVSATWTYFGRTWSLRTLFLVSFFPGLFVPWFVGEPGFLKQVLGVGKISDASQFSIFGGMLALIVITISIFVSYVIGWGKIDERAHVADTTHDLVTGFLRAAGEEVGWRCYLLPALLQHHSTLAAVMISGIVWALYQGPVTYLLVRRHRSARPHTIVTLKLVHCVLFSVLHSWVAIKSGFSLWPSTFVQYTWNRINPVIMGNLYTNKSGKVIGEQWLVNGEGVAGCLSLLPISAYILYHIVK